MIELGTKMRCKYTGFTGVAAVRCQYLNVPDRYCLRNVDKDGKMVDTWIDEGDLVPATAGDSQ